MLYPDESTLYDARVCDVLGDFTDLYNVTDFDRLWDRYQEYKRKVEEAAPRDFTLRDKDRYLWGKSFHNQLNRDIAQAFGVAG